MSFNYDFRDAFNRFVPEAQKRTEEDLGELFRAVIEGSITKEEEFTEALSIKIASVGHITIKVLEEYHQYLLKYLSSKGLD